MPDQVVVEVSLGVVVTDADALVAAAIEHFEAAASVGQPAESVISFKEHLRANLGSAVHQLIAPEHLVASIPGVQFEGHTATARVRRPGEPLPWARSTS
jgi:hypothetical protein